MKLSLCLAVYNEEKNIHYPLDSAYDIADEVIIVDGGSTDRTVAVAKSYGPKVKVFHESNPPMFHINKQKAIERASGEWILQLDADEALSPELKQEIVILLYGHMANKDKQQYNNIAIKQYDAYWIPRKNWFLSRFLMKGGQYPDYTIRLYRNGVARFPCKDVHENVEIISNIKNQISKTHIKNQKASNNIAINNQQLTIGYLKHPILHYADPTFSRYLMRWHRYNSLDAEILLRKSNIKYQISKTHIKNQRFIQKIMFYVSCYMLYIKLLFNYLLVKPIITFVLIYFRHKGFLDGWPGFVFAFFSAIRFWEIYFIWFRLEK